MVKDKTVATTVNQLPKADPNIKGEVGAPMKGEIVEMKVGVGDNVIKGQNLAVLSAMKMEMVLQSPVDGVVRAIEVKRGQTVEGEDLMIVIKEEV
jgi:pyruvate carboxylase